MTSTTITGERADLLETLAKHRSLLRHTARDLTDEQAAARTTVSELCVGGLIKHVAKTEDGWATFILDGPAGQGPVDAAAYEAHAQSFRMLPGETLAGLLADYEKVAARTDELVRTLPDLDASHPLPADPWFASGGGRPAGRGVLGIVGGA